MPKPKNMNGKPDEEDFGLTLVIISVMKFPPPASANALIYQELERMVATRNQLAWLNEALTHRVAEWPGLPQLRALFCTRFSPADGIDPTSIDCAGPRISCTVPGFTPDEFAGQQAVIEQSRRDALPGGQRLIASGEEISEDIELRQSIRQLAAGKSMPGPKIVRKA